MGTGDTFYLSAEAVREHSAHMSKMRRTAESLHTAILRMRALDAPENIESYVPMLARAERLTRYFAQMHNVLERIAEDADEFQTATRQQLLGEEREMRQEEKRAVFIMNDLLQ